MEITWKPVDSRPGQARSDLPDTAFAFPNERKEPLTDALHVRAALARFSQVDGVSDEERAQALRNINAAAQYYGVKLGGKPKAGSF